VRCVVGNAEQAAAQRIDDSECPKLPSGVRKIGPEELCEYTVAIDDHRARYETLHEN
jgi:hypothetical protein